MAARTEALFVGALLVAIGLWTVPARADDLAPTSPSALQTPGVAELPLVAPAAPSAPISAAMEERRRAATKLEASIAAEEDKADGWAIEDVHFRVAGFYQNGRGLQSRAGKTTFSNVYERAPIGSRGIEEAWILEPLVLLDVRQTKRLHHEIYLPVDIVSAASPDGVDLVAHASRVNEAFAIDVTSTYKTSDLLDMSFRYGFHAEEPLRSFDAGPIFTFHLAENNTVITVSALIVADGFDPIALNGKDLGFTSRSTFSGNLSIAQVLSPTTLFDASIGTTEQWGTLQTGWNSVVAHREPGEAGDPVYRTTEVFPMSRNRDAIFGRISQHIPLTHSTVKASYRFYWDENHATAHTGELMLYQYIVPWLYVRVHGRIHQQTQPVFWTEFIQNPFKPTKWRTSDSDLETFFAREAGLRLVLVRDKAPASFRGSDSFDVGYLHYQRSNSLHADYVSLGYTKSF